ncbi:MAG: ribosome silencing factor [Holdemanella sp.]|nr:ribosome silencing factor [Holdemanella sp.]
MEFKDIVLKAISEKKGFDICDYDCRTLTPFMDHMIVVSTNNIRQNNAIAQNIKDRLKENNVDIQVRVEGNTDSRWLLIDLQEIVVNLFVHEERQVYQLDRLYGDVPCQVYDL